MRTPVPAAQVKVPPVAVPQMPLAVPPVTGSTRRSEAGPFATVTPPTPLVLSPMDRQRVLPLGYGWKYGSDVQLLPAWGFAATANRALLILNPVFEAIATPPAISTVATISTSARVKRDFWLGIFVASIHYLKNLGSTHTRSPARQSAPAGIYPQKRVCQAVNGTITRHDKRPPEPYRAPDRPTDCPAPRAPVLFP